MADRRELAALAANLACRERLGLGLVTGSREELVRLLALVGGEAPPAVERAPSRASARLPATPSAPSAARRGPGPFPGSPPSPAARRAEPAPPPPPPPPEELGDSLAAVRAAMGECKRCPLHERRHVLVFGAGPAGARLMLIGEGPGGEEDRRGEPFVGPAGQLLDRMLQAVGIAREEVYITNLVKCRPPGNREPQPGEVAACRPFLEAQVRLVAPRVIVTLGRPAAQALLASSAPIGALRGNWGEYRGIPLLPTFHPAYLLRSPERKREAYRDLKALRERLGE